MSESTVNITIPTVESVEAKIQELKLQISRLRSLQHSIKNVMQREIPGIASMPPDVPIALNAPVQREIPESQTQETF